MSNGEITTRIIENLPAEGTIRIGELADRTGLTAQELRMGIMDLGDAITTEPESHRTRITNRDREVAPEIGGEARHLIGWR